MPKPPPTLSAMMRNLVSGTLKISSAMVRRIMCGAWTVQRRRDAILARVVLGEAAARLHGIGGQAADDHAVRNPAVGRGEGRSTAALSPSSCTKAWLSGHASHTAGAPGATASAIAVTAGSGS